MCGTAVNKGFGVLQMSSAKLDGMKYGYVRVSTGDQNPALQLAPPFRNA
jgi:hypothetical protein